MKSVDLRTIGQTRWWWLVLAVGILLVIGGCAYWFWPGAGYAVASQIFGWLLVMTGIVQLCVAAGPNSPKGWGWWIAGGVLDMFIGFMLVRSVILSEAVFPYFLSFVFLYWGIEAFANAARRRNKYWWLGIINGILLAVIGFFFLEAGWTSNMYMVSFLASIAFIYWGFTIAIAAYDLKPEQIER